MNKNMKYVYLILVLVFCLFSCTNKENPVANTQNNTTNNGQSTTVDTNTLNYDKNNAIVVSMDKDVAVDLDNKLMQDDTSITLKSGNTYILKGNLVNKQIKLVKDTADSITLILDNVQIETNQNNAILSQDDIKVNVISEKGTKNNINLVTNNTGAKELKNCSVIFSQDDITLGGEGNLNLKAGFESLVESKSNMTFVSGNYVLNTKADALRTKNQLLIKNGNFFIESGDDSIKITNEKNGNFCMENGTVRIKANDKGINSDNEVNITGGALDIDSKGECISGRQVNVYGGVLNLKTDDDAINATDPNQNKKSNQTGVFVRIAGGNLNIDSGMDGIDSNGALYLEGGKLLINGANNDNERIIDYNGDIVLDDAKGFEMLGVGPSAKMQDLGENPKQNYIIVYFANPMNANDNIVLKDNNGNIVLSLKAIKQYHAIIATSKQLIAGEKYKIVAGTKEIDIILNKGKNEIEV